MDYVKDMLDDSGYKFSEEYEVRLRFHVICLNPRPGEEGLEKYLAQQRLERLTTSPWLLIGKECHLSKLAFKFTVILV